MKKLKKIQLRENTQILNENQMKMVLGGSSGSSCSSYDCDTQQLCSTSDGFQGRCRYRGDFVCSCSTN